MKTTVNVNEVESSKSGGAETQAALNELAKAKKTIKELEERNKQLQTKGHKSNQNATPSAESTSSYLQEQVEFMKAQMSKLQSELNDKEVTIQKILAEKREFVKRYDSLETRNNQLQETI